MTNHEEQARRLIADAEKKLSPKSFLHSLFGFYKNRREEAIECYQKAGTLFKLSKNWLQAATAFRLAADLNLEINNRTEAAQNYVLASKCMEKYDANAAANLLLTAIQIYTDLGRFVMAAKLHSGIGDIYEQNLELDKAVQHYEQAADYFKAEENYTSAKRCLLRVAQYASAEFEDYAKAIAIYEEVALYDLKVPILQYNAKDSFFKAVLCHLCIDVLNGRHALDLYTQKYPAFTITREYGLLRSIIEHVEDSDEDAFTRRIQEYDNQSRLDTWHTRILLKIKRQMRQRPDLL